MEFGLDSDNTSTGTLESDDSFDWDLSGNIEYYDFEERGKVLLKQSVACDLEEVAKNKIGTEKFQLNTSSKRNFTDIMGGLRETDSKKSKLIVAPKMDTKHTENFSYKIEHKGSDSHLKRSSSGNGVATAAGSSCSSDVKSQKSNSARVKGALLLALGANKLRQERSASHRRKFNGQKLKMLKQMHLQVELLKKKYNLVPSTE